MLAAPEAHGQESLTVVINEFGQGTAGSGEWVELLVVGTGPCTTVDLRGFRLLDREGYLNLSSPTRVVFRNMASWAAVPAGTIIVVYNGTPAQAGNFPPGFPFNDLDFSDFRVSIPHNNATFFENVAWGGFLNAGDYVVLVNDSLNLVDGLSYGDKTGEGTAPEVKLGAVSDNRAAWFTGGSTALINSVGNWATGSENGGASTPGAGNTPTNAAWIQSLRPDSVSVSVTPSSHGFGNVTVGETSVPLLVTVTNTGCANLTVGTITLAGTNPDQFAIQNDLASGQTIPSGGSRTVEVVFRPTSSGPKSAQLSVPSSAPTATVTLTGTGGPENPAVVINEFGQGKAGENGEWVELLVVGTGPCSTVDMRGWTLRDLQGETGGHSPTRLTFANVAAWQAVPAGTLIVIYNGVDVDYLPDHFPPFPDLDFLDSLVVLPHTHAYFTGAAWGGLGNPGDWVVLRDGLGTLVDGISYGNQPGGLPHLASVPATRAAGYIGSGTADINTAGNWIVGYEVMGTPLSTPGAGNTPTNSAWIQDLRSYSVSVTPSSHGFGDVTVGGASAPLLVTVKNTGVCANLTVGTITLNGTNPDQFRIQNDSASNQTIPPGGSRTVEVVFRPTSPGTKSAQLSIPSNAGTATVSLAGTGVAMAVYTITVSASPAAGGTVSGGGTYLHGAPATVTAAANPRYRFLNWTESGVEVSTSASYAFTVTGGRDLVANFVRLGDVNLDGTVDVRDVRMVHQAALGLVTLTPLQRLAADVDGDGMITVADAETVAAWIVECP